MIKIEGDVAAVESALARAEERAEQLGAKAIVRCLANPDESMTGLIHFPNAQNPLCGGRDQFLPTDFPQIENKIMSNKQEALGILETQGLTAILEATDAMAEVRECDGRTCGSRCSLRISSPAAVRNSQALSTDFLQSRKSR